MFFSQEKEDVQQGIPFRSPFLSKIAERISNSFFSGAKTGWVKRSIQGYQYYLKTYQQPSPLGINGSRISKLEVWKDGVLVVNYDRGWDIQPETGELQMVVNAILKDNG